MWFAVLIALPQTDSTSIVVLPCPVIESRRNSVRETVSARHTRRF